MDNENDGRLTLRQLLPHVKYPIALKIIERGEGHGLGTVEMHELSGDTMLRVLETTCLVPGNKVLECEPDICVEEAEATMTRGSICTNYNSRVQVVVKIERAK